MKHHLNKAQLLGIDINNYKLGARYCRMNSKKGGMCVYVHKNITSPVDVKNYCIEYDMEAYVLKVHLDYTIIHILTIYRSPAGDFAKFFEILDNILRFLINPKTETIICGDINVNYFINSNRKYQLNSLLNSYNLMDTVHFPTRTQHTSVSIIGNIFIDYSRINNYSISPCYNGISDQDGQPITIYNTINSQPMSNSYVIRKINQMTLSECFANQLNAHSMSLFIIVNNYPYTCFSPSRTIIRGPF
jgi:hypothetical protein